MDQSIQPDAFIKVCPSRDIVARLSDKWSMLVIALLNRQEEPVRFGQLKAQIEGISQKVLTQTLRKLERDGLVKRQVYNEMPLRVEYHLTDMAHDFVPIVQDFKKWAETHMHEILEQNKRYDDHNTDRKQF